jgi:hypothetical protein
MVYACLLTINPRATVLIMAGMIAICVELFRLHHQPQLDTFRSTLADQLLLGENILALEHCRLSCRDCPASR